MAKYFTNFDEYPVGDIATSGQTEWAARITNGAADYRILDGGLGDKFLRINATGTNGSRVLAYTPLDGVSDNIETLVKFWVFKSGSDGSLGRFGAAYTRYGGTNEASTIGYSVGFTPVSNVKSLVLNEDSTGVVQFANYPWAMSTQYYVRTRLSGTLRQVKIWPASSAEPTSWTFQSNGALPTIANPYSGVGTYQADSFLYVEQFSAGTDGDTAPMSAAEMVPSSTPIVGYSGGWGGVFAGYGSALGLAKQNTVLEVADATHDHIVTSVTVAQVHSLAASNATHGHSATSPALKQAHKLTIANTTHAHAASSPSLAITHNLVIDNTVHEITSDSPQLVTGFAVVADSTVHALTSDNIQLKQHQTLVVANATHTHVATSPVLIEAKTLSVSNAVHVLEDSIGKLEVTHYLAVADTLHTLKSDNVVLTQSALLSVANTVHSLKSDNIDIVQFTLLNKPDDTVHGLRSDNIEVIQQHILAIDDALHRLKSDTILKIFDWTELGLDFGMYKPDRGDIGNLTQVDPGDAGIYNPKYYSQGQLNGVELETPGLYKPKNYETGIY